MDKRKKKVQLNNDKDLLSKLQEKNLKEDEERELQFELHAMNRKGSFIQLLDILTSYVELSLSDRLVYCAIRNYAESDITKQLKTNVANEGLSERIGLSMRTVSDSLKNLQKLGIIDMYKNPNKYERIIKIRRNFREKQPEQEKAEQVEKDKITPDEDIIY